MRYDPGTSALLLIEFAVCLGSLVAMWIAIVRILHRTGYSGWWSLVMLVPVANAVALWIYSRADWPRSLGAPSYAAATSAQASAPRPAPSTPSAPRRAPVRTAQPVALPDPQHDNVF